MIGQTATWPTEYDFEAHCNHIIDAFGDQHADELDEDGASGASICEADDGDDKELDYRPVGPDFGISHHAPELGDECDDWANFAAKGHASGSSSSAWTPDPLIAALPQQDVMTSNAHTSIAPHISSQDLYQKKTITSPEKLEVAATKKRHAEVLGDKLQPPPAPLLRTRFMIGK